MLSRLLNSLAKTFHLRPSDQSDQTGIFGQTQPASATPSWHFPLPKFWTNNNQWLEQQQTTILSAAIIISASGIMSALSGLIVRRALIGTFFGNPVSQQALEAFWVAFQIPDTMFQLIVLGALSAAFIPIFTAYKKKDQETAFTMSSIMMNLLLAVFVIVGALVFVFAEQLTNARTGARFTPEQVTIVTNLTRIMIFAQFFFAISNFFSGILQSYQRFILPAIAPILYNVGTWLGVYLFAESMGIYSAGVGVVIGAFIHMLIQLPLAYRLGFRWQFSFNWRMPGIGEFFKLMPARVVAIGAQQIRQLLMGFFATSLGNLSFFMMQLALSLMVIPIRFFGVPISQASLPFLSEESDEQALTKFKDLVLQSLHQIAFLAMPASVLLLILRIPVVRLTFGTENFPWSATITTGRIVAIAAVSITVQALVHLLIRAFYALKDTKTPLYIALVDVILYCALNAGFIYWTNWGVLGLALATSITAFVEFLLFLYLLDKKVHGFARREFWIPQIKMIVASFFMAVFLYLPFRIFDELIFNTSRTIELIGLTITTSSIGMLVYIYFAVLLDIKELHLITNLIYSFGKWTKPLEKSEEVIMESSLEGDGA